MSAAFTLLLQTEGDGCWGQKPTSDTCCQSLQAWVGAVPNCVVTQCLSNMVLKEGLHCGTFFSRETRK